MLIGRAYKNLCTFTEQSSLDRIFRSVPFVQVVSTTISQLLAMAVVELKHSADRVSTAQRLLRNMKVPFELVQIKR